MEMPLHMLIAFTYLPGFVTLVFRGMPARCGVVAIVSSSAGSSSCKPSRPGARPWQRWPGGRPPPSPPGASAACSKAAYWNVHLLVSWLAQDLLATLPAPANGIVYLFGDGSHADKRGTKNPVAQKGRISQHHPWFFGLRFVLLMAAWDGYRLPVGFRIILPKRHPGYRSENALFREMVGEFSAELGEAGHCGGCGLRPGQHADGPRPRQSGYDTPVGLRLCDRSRGKLSEEKTLKNLVTHLPHIYYQRTQVPREGAGKGRRTFWTYHTRVCLRHVGDVTLVLSKKGRNTGPHNTKLLVTNLAELTPRQVVSMYQKRWAIELMHWELKSGLGLGEHQVSGNKIVVRNRLALGYWRICLCCGCVITRLSPANPGVFFSFNMRCGYGP